MATQPTPAPAPSNGGNNHVGLRLGDKSLSVQSSQLVLLVFVIAVGVLSWQRAQTLATHLERVQTTQTQLLDAIHTGDTKLEAVLLDELHTLREALLTRQVAIQQTSSEERAALRQALAAHGQQTQAQQSAVAQCLDQLPALLQLLRQRMPGP